MEIPYYPINEFGPAMKGMIIGGLGIFHVFVAQFAIGGGMLMCYFQWLSQTGRNPHAREALDKYFKVLVLVSFVLGVLTGVLAGRLISALFQFPVAFSAWIMGTSVGVAMAVGIGFGLYPAWIAARMDPVEALRW